jgi:hypothetical protein
MDGRGEKIGVLVGGGEEAVNILCRRGGGMWLSDYDIVLHIPGSRNPGGSYLWRASRKPPAQASCPWTP